MRRVMMAGLGVAVLFVGLSAGAETASCMFEVEPDVLAPWQGPCWDGKAYGEGVAHLPNGRTYRGSAEDGRAHGHGRLTLQDGGSYEGEWSDGKRHGRGTAVDAEGDRHEGEFVNGRPHGWGTGSSPEGGTHTGWFEDGVPVGPSATAGTAEAPESRDVVHSPGGVAVAESAGAEVGAACQLDIGGAFLDWSGPCKDGKAFGEGRATAPDGSTYEGSARNGKPHGFGTVNAAGGYYQGEYQDGVPHGKGTVRGTDGRYYRAEFRDGYQHSDRIPMEGVAAADPWSDLMDEGAVEPREAMSGSDPWADDPGLAIDDPWAPESSEADPWALDGAAPGPGAAGNGSPEGHVPSGRETEDFNYAAALRALDGADGIVRPALPDDDYTRELMELERRAAERRATELAREAERRAEQLREEVAAQQAEERRARHEAEEASRRAALEREAVEAWREPEDSYEDDSYESYEWEPSNSTLFDHGSGALEAAAEEVLRRVVPSMGQQHEPGGNFGSDDGISWRSTYDPNRSSGSSSGCEGSCGSIQ